MIWFYRRGNESRTCETRLAADGVGYELVVTTDGQVQIEHFDELNKLLAREHELLSAWRALGWRQASTGRRTP